MLKRVRFLFVDDEENIRRALRRIVNDEPWECDFADSGEQALRLSRETGPYDVVVADYRMPGMTGVELLRNLRETCPTTIRVILSSYAEPEIILDAINEGAAYKFIVKTSSNEVLLGTLRETAELARLRHENSRLLTRLQVQESEIHAVDWLFGQLKEIDVYQLPASGWERPALEALSGPAVVEDSAGKVVFANRAAREGLGESGAEFAERWASWAEKGERREVAGFPHWGLYEPGSKRPG